LGYYGPDGWLGSSGHPILVETSAAAKNDDLAKELWEFSEKVVGLEFPN
jgi:hypothetical protein